VVLDFGDANHTLCHAAELLPDAEVARKRESERKAQEKALREELPKALNKDLQHAYVQANLLGDGFFWNREGSAFTLKGVQEALLRVYPDGEQTFRASFETPQGELLIVSGVSFDYAFGAAEDYARTNRRQFVLADRNASWRKQPISEGQARLFNKNRYRKGINQLTKGQASDIIASGVLRNKIPKYESRSGGTA